MNITLIGGSGFVGTRLIDLLEKDDRFNIMNIDIQPSHFFNQYTIFGDVRNPGQLNGLLKGCDVVVLLLLGSASSHHIRISRNRQPLLQ